MKILNVCEKRQPLLVDYCQFLLASFEKFTQTYFADHTEKWSHDQLNRLLREERISARDLWASVKHDIEFDRGGYLLFDDTVISKPYAREIEAVRPGGIYRRSIPLIKTCHRRFQQWSSDGTLAKVLKAVAGKLQKRRQLNMSECSIDGKFVSAKKGVNVSVRRSVVKAQS